MLYSTIPVVPETPLENTNPFDHGIKLRDTSPLAVLYNRVLGVVESYQPLMAAADEVSENFDFFTSVIWHTISSAIVTNLGSIIFAAGRPDELHEVRSSPDELTCRTIPSPIILLPRWRAWRHLSKPSCHSAEVRITNLSRCDGNFQYTFSFDGSRSWGPWKLS